MLLNNSFSTDSMENSTSVNSYENRDYVLWRLNEKAYLDRFVPATIYIGCMILLGGTGNGLVLCVYKSEGKSSTANTFIFFLSVLDFLLCTIVMPFKLFDVRFPLMYGFNWPCKLYEFTEISLSMIAVSMMICIAVDRYLIVSKPLKRLDSRKLKKILLICFVVGTLCSTPTLVVYGQSKVKTKMHEIDGTTCGVAEEMKTSLVTRIWYMYMYVVFVLTLLVLIILYVRIWHLIKIWNNTIIGETVMRSDYKYKAIFKRKHLQIDKPLIPYGRDKNVEMRSFYNPHSLDNELHERDTFNFDQSSEENSFSSNPDSDMQDSNTSLINNIFNKQISPIHHKESHCNNNSIEHAKLVSCMRKSRGSSSCTSPTKRRVRLSSGDSLFSSSCRNNCNSVVAKVNRDRMSSSNSVFSHGSTRGYLNSTGLLSPSNRRRLSSNDSVFSSSRNSHRKSSSRSVSSRKRKESFLSGSSSSSFGKRARMRRNTVVFGTISLVFVLSYLPCLVVVGMRTLQIYKVMGSPAINSQVAEIFVRSGYMNSVLNPFIYSFLVPTFRRGVKRMFTMKK